MIKFNQTKTLGNELKYIEKVFETGNVSGNGFFTKECEVRVKELTGSLDALIVHSCTAALEIAAILCALGPGDEVIMPSFTFVSTANAVVLRGATPVFVDIDPRTLNIDIASVRAAITERSKAIIAVHYAGVSADMDELFSIATENDLVLIEDAAQALGARYRGHPCGSLGHLACFSFHETKNLTSGEGGALTINSPEFLERALVVRDKGTNRQKFRNGLVDKYTWVDIGSSYSPSEINAAMLLAQLEQIETINSDRMNTVSIYCKAFEALEREGRVRMLDCPSHCQSNGHLFFLILKSVEDRDSFIAYMRSKGIETPFHYVPLHSSVAGKMYGRTSGQLSTTDQVSSCLVRLPLYYGMGESVSKVIEVAHEYLCGNVKYV